MKKAERWQESLQPLPPAKSTRKVHLTSGWSTTSCTGCANRLKAEQAHGVQTHGTKQTRSAHSRLHDCPFLESLSEFPHFTEKKKCCLLAEAVLWRCVFLQGAISLACKHWTFTCLLALGHFPNFGFFHTMSKAHSCFGTAEALAGRKKLFGPSAQLRVLQSLCAPGVCAGTVWLVGWQHSAHSSISMDPDANFCPILGSSHCISDNNKYKKEKGEYVKSLSSRDLLMFLLSLKLLS